MSALPQLHDGAFAHINRYWDRVHACPAAKLLPGECYVSVSHSELITTVLGSCVSACVWSSEAGVGGMNHFMLPDGARDSGWGPAVSNATRYGTHAMEFLINELLKLGARREDLRIKMFGGGRVMAGMSDVGAGNIAFMRRFLRDEKLELVAEDVGGRWPRKVVFFPATGRARVKKLVSLHNNTLLEREQDYRRRLQDDPLQGDVELF
ncbi:chemotaxis protein CheD [Thioalkalivibrio versutus]|uniref:Probable chemoreceptor glutamine deamidase CheD n=1 Tax=Thioalkalivibrio versutus TaxID=106634 RepID=A0A0G3G517_9GAMM|nr:chemoreceptor glutamine deamidase CheD [Thioalkalivibrio versutus]AKJ93956.1 chemotaxis protein CheD [Thioalkalivibrio versutus]